MNKRKLTVLLICCMLVLGTVLAGCSKDKDSASGGDKIVKYNNLKEPTSLDPPVGFDQASYDILNNYMEGLTRLGKEQTPEPAMALKWEMSADGKIYTFTLRDGLKWSNGDAFKASDFEFAWKRLLNPETASPAASLAYIIQGAEAYNSGSGNADDVLVKATDDKTLVVTLNQPSSWLLSMISNPAFFPVNQAVVEKDAKWAGEAATIVSNGPFKLTEWKHDSEIKLVKNDSYWDATNVKLDGVTFTMINDENTEYQSFIAGDLHTSAIPSDMADQLFAEAGKVQVSDGAGTAFYRFNVTLEPFTNVNIRKAFVMAVDRKQLVDLVTKRQEKPAEGFVSYGMKEPSGKDFREVGGTLITFDAAEAKSLLAKGMAEEGYTTLPQVTLTYNTSDTSKRIAEAIQAMFKDNLGIDVLLANKEGKVVTAEQKALQLQISRSSFLADFQDPINYLDGYQTDNGMNRTGWSNADYDALIKNAYAETDEAKRFDLLHQAEQLLMDEAPVLPLYYYSTAYLQSDKLSGVIRHAFGYIEFKSAELK
ncbi:MAG: peptide ABC transporter substrate-binding protein [Gorillibacterium sp.]|nr:peptide ABC transporter substrate-binding protein [Gorillibacterium sp.]